MISLVEDTLKELKIIASSYLIMETPLNKKVLEFFILFSYLLILKSNMDYRGILYEVGVVNNSKLGRGGYFVTFRFKW